MENTDKTHLLGLEEVAVGLVRVALVSALSDPAVRKTIRDAVHDEFVEFERNMGLKKVFDSTTMTVKQAAQFANVTEGTIRYWISKKKLTALKAGNRHRIVRDELIRCMADTETREIISVEAEAAKIVARDHQKLKKKGS